MNNIFESIKILIQNEKLKQKFIFEFNKQINWLSDWDEKWKNYESFLNDEEILDIFLMEFDVNFIEKQIIWFINISNINIDNISENLPKFIDKLFLKKCITWLNDDERSSWVELINNLWNLIQQSFYNNSYNEDSKLYQWFKENLTLFKLIFALILHEIKKEEDYDKISSNIKNKFVDLLDTWIYQFISFAEQNKAFSKHKFLISIIWIFIEESDRRFDFRTYNMQNTSVATPNIFDLSINDFNQSEELLLILKGFWLTFNFLRKIESNKIINDDYKSKILLSLLNYGICENSELVDFSKLFSKFDEVKIKYIETIANIIIEDKKIIENLSDIDNWLTEDTINFLFFEENKKYLTDPVKIKLVKILKDKIIVGFYLNDDKYQELLIKFIDWKLWEKNLWLNMTNFWNKLIQVIINYLEWYDEKDYELMCQYIENIKRLLSENDIKDFRNKYYEEIINNVSIFDINRFKKIKYLLFEFEIEKDNLDNFSSKIKTDYLDDTNILEMYLLLLANYKKKYSYSWLKENLESKLEENLSENLKNILEQILKLIK